MDRLTTRLTGDKELRRKLLRLQKVAPQLVQDANVATGFEILTDTRLSLTEQQAVDKGQLRSSYHVETTGTRIQGLQWNKPYYDAPAMPGDGTYTDDDGRQFDGSLNVILESEAGVAVGTNALHGAFVELGTIKMAARPALQPAVEKARPKLIKRQSAALKKAAEMIV